MEIEGKPCSPSPQLSDGKPSHALSYETLDNHASPLKTERPTSEQSNAQPKNSESVNVESEHAPSDQHGGKAANTSSANTPVSFPMGVEEKSRSPSPQPSDGKPSHGSSQEAKVAPSPDVSVSLDRSSLGSEGGSNSNRPEISTGEEQESSSNHSSSAVEEVHSSTPVESEAASSGQSVPSSSESTDEEESGSSVGRGAPSVEVVDELDDPAQLPSEPSVEARSTTPGQMAAIDDLVEVAGAGSDVMGDVVEASSQLVVPSYPVEAQFNAGTNQLNGPSGVEVKEVATEAAPLFGGYPMFEPTAALAEPVAYNPFAKLGMSTEGSRGTGVADVKKIVEPTAEIEAEEITEVASKTDTKNMSKKRDREEIETRTGTTKRRRFVDVCDQLSMRMPSAEATIEEIVMGGARAKKEPSKTQRRSKLLSRLNRIESSMQTGLSALDNVEATLFREQDGGTSIERRQFNMGSRTQGRVYTGKRREGRIVVRARQVFARNSRQIAKLADMSSDRAAQLSMDMMSLARTRKERESGFVNYREDEAE